MLCAVPLLRSPTARPLGIVSTPAPPPCPVGKGTDAGNSSVSYLFGRLPEFLQWGCPTLEHVVLTQSQERPAHPREPAAPRIAAPAPHVSCHVRRTSPGK